jgi:15-cis-phytoene synthase
MSSSRRSPGRQPGRRDREVVSVVSIDGGPARGGLDAAYQHCAEITRAQARNFWYGIRLLPSPKRRALSAVYAVARRADDIADGDAPVSAKLAGLARLRAELRSLPDTSGDPVLVALADAAGRLPIPLEAFEELLDGCEADVRGTSYQTFEDLVVYCRQVAGSVGRLSLGVFGARGDLAAASGYADSLGVALQLANILRDIREDSANGRVYLPAADLARFSVGLALGPDGEFVDPSAAVARLVAFEAARARVWFDRGLPLLSVLDHRSAACCGAMAAIYSRLLRRISADPAAPTRTRLSVPAWEKAAVAVRCLAMGAA